MVAPLDADHPPGPTFNEAGFYGPQILFSILTYITVALRLWSRRLQEKRFDGSDYWVVVALIFRLIGEIEAYAEVRDVHDESFEYIQFTDPSGNEALMQVKLFTTSALVYLLSLASAKFSLLLLYRGIFPTKTMKMAVPMLALIILILTVGNFFATIFSCGKAPDGWLPSLLQQPNCISDKKLFQFAGVMNIFTDVACLSLPVYETLRLQLNRKNRAIVIAVFSLGGINIVVSIPRLVIISQDDPSTATVGLWSCVETGVAIISVCLPVMRPVLRRIWELARSTRRISIREKWMPPVGRPTFSQSEKDIEFKAAEAYYASKRHKSRSMTPVPSWPSSGIVVEQSFELKSLHTSKSVKHPNNKSARQSRGDVLLPDMPPLRPYIEGVQQHSEAVRVESPRRVHTSDRRASTEYSESNYSARSGSYDSMETMEKKAWIHIMLI